MELWKRTIFHALTAAALASAGAAAQTATTEGVLESMIRTADGIGETHSYSVPQQALQTEYSDILRYLSSNGSDADTPATEETSTEDADGSILRVLGMMNPFGALNVVAAESPSTGLGALSYLAGVYGGSGYYQTGYWGKQTNGLPSAAISGPLPEFDATDFYRPVWGIITSRYGYRPKFGRMHYGVDLALNIGDTVRAALPGIVTLVSYDGGGYGNYVTIKHNNGVETRYGHLSQSLALPGQRVEAGEAIALGGNTGNSTGPHLHFEARYMGTPVDPLKVFDFSGRSMALYAKMRQEPGSNLVATGFNGGKTSLKQKSTYVVRQGDTVKKIAERAGISALKLCQLNFITEGTPLSPGTMLKLK